MLKISEMEKRQFEVEKKNNQLSSDFESFKIITNTIIEEINVNFPQRDDELEEMIKNLQSEINILINRPEGTGNIDTSMFVGHAEYESLM